MKTNFFTHLATLLVNGLDLTLTFRKTPDGQLVVGVRPQRNDVAALSNIQPIVLTHPAEALDESFFETINAPVSAIDSAAAQIKAFTEETEKAVKEAKEKSEKKSGGGQSSKAKASAKKGKSKTSPSPMAKATQAANKEEKKTEKTKVEKPAVEEKPKPTDAEIKATKAIKNAEIIFNGGIGTLETHPDASLKAFNKALKMIDGLAGTKDLTNKIVEAISTAQGKINEKGLTELNDAVAGAEAKMPLYPEQAIDEAAKATKLLKSFPVTQSTPEVLMAIEDRILAVQSQAAKAINEKKALPLFERAEAFAKAMNYGELKPVLQEALSLAPEHTKGQEIKANLIKQLGEGFVNQLLNSK